MGKKWLFCCGSASIQHNVLSRFRLLSIVPYGAGRPRYLYHCTLKSITCYAVDSVKVTALFRFVLLCFGFRSLFCDGGSVTAIIFFQSSQKRVFARFAFLITFSRALCDLCPSRWGPNCFEGQNTNPIFFILLKPRYCVPTLRAVCNLCPFRTLIVSRKKYCNERTQLFLS